MTPRKKVERALIAAQRNSGLSVLAGGIAHDFNNLLTAILGNATLGLQPEATQLEMREALQHASRAAESASALTRQLLAYAGKGRFVLEVVSLSTVVRDMAELLRASVPHNISMDVDVTPDSTLVRVDVSQLQQVVMNLITNAAEAIGAAHGIVSVQTSRVEADRAYLAESFGRRELAPGLYATLEVSDTGAGMPREVIERVFDPFFTTKDRGHGLGMAAVLGIVEGHGGALRIYSEAGKGTTVKLLLPVHTGQLAEASTTMATVSHQQATVLIVDDEEMLRSLGRRLLTRAGYRVIEAVDGIECVELYQRNQVDLVLLDLTMPRMDGSAAFRELRRIDPDVRVLLTSGYNERATTARFAGKGLAGFLQKPYTSKQLLGAVREMLPPTGTEAD